MNHRNPPAEQVENADLYYLIGYRSSVSEQGARTVSRFLLQGFGEIALSLMLEMLPDGVIFQRGGCCYVSEARRLIDFDPQGLGWINYPTHQDEADMTPKEWSDYIRSEWRGFKEFLIKFTDAYSQK